MRRAESGRRHPGQHANASPATWAGAYDLRFSIGTGRDSVVIIKTLDELRQVDDRTLRFTPMGLGLGVQMRPEDAAEFQ